MTLRQDFAGAAGADAALLLTVGKSLVAIHDWTFLLGQFDAGGERVLLGYLMYTSRLVPRPSPCWGWSEAPCSLADRNSVRALRASVRVGSDRDTPGCCLGADAWHLAHR